MTKNAAQAFRIDERRLAGYNKRKALFEMETLHVVLPAELRHLVQKIRLRKAAQAQLETLLLAGFDSGPMEEMPASEWDDLRRELRERGTIGKQ